MSKNLRKQYLRVLSTVFLTVFVFSGCGSQTSEDAEIVEEIDPSSHIEEVTAIEEPSIEIAVEPEPEVQEFDKDTAIQEFYTGLGGEESARRFIELAQTSEDDRLRIFTSSVFDDLPQESREIGESRMRDAALKAGFSGIEIKTLSSLFDE